MESKRDEAKNKVLGAYDKFLAECILSKKSSITDIKEDIFTLSNVEKCIEIWEKMNPENDIKTARKEIKEIARQYSFVPHILAHCDWLLDLPNSLEGKYEDYGVKYKEDEEKKFFFKFSVASSKLSRTANALNAISDMLSFFKFLLSPNKEDPNLKEGAIKWLGDGAQINLTPLARNVLLYLNDPASWDGDTVTGNFPILSNSNKKSIYDAFQRLIGSSEQTDDVYSKIATELRGKLGEVKGIEWINNPFYSPIIYSFWNKGDDTELSEQSALKFKKSIILYGPPGTSKTYSAKEIARQFIRCQQYGLDNYLKNPNKAEIDIPRQIHRLQLHPNYTYEDFVWGYQLENNKSVAKKGYFLRLLDEITGDDKIHVLILDEINRVDLSRLFGELFSGIENRNEKIELQQKVEGTKFVKIPGNLYIIGTMNEIDFSLERLDFALRRRFVWFFKGYDEEVLRAMIYKGIENNSYDIDVDDYLHCCTELNKKISGDEDLGEQFQIGHTFFADIIPIIKDGKKYKDAKKILWNISIKPMLEAYLGNMPAKDRKKKISENSNQKNDSTFGNLFLGIGK